tara:strand:+ start:316 stop:702 length:387 start_codon:yes stop_codon:yes gene_type:complete
MPLVIHNSPSILKKLLKSNLVIHVLELYNFIDLFSGESIVKLKEENKKLKKENEELFNAWLYYWSGSEQGEEHSTPMSSQENGKYQRILEGESDSDDEYPVCNTCGGGHGRFVDGISYCDDWDCVQGN